MFLFYIVLFFFGHETCRILAPQLGIEPEAPTLEGKVLTTGPPGKSLQNSVNGEIFNSLENCKRHLEQFFFFLLKKIKKFWEDEMMKLPEKWQKIVEQNGDYIVQ